MTAYEEALAYLQKAAQRGSVLGLERISALTELLGQPQDSIKTVHISGTNGKGSLGAMLCSVLKSAGYRAGSFSSPAITNVTDSFRIDGETVSDEKFSQVILDIAPMCESMDEKPTEFEVLTAAAFELFRRESCDIAVIECGMGGDLDSTNVISLPLLSVITNVQLDHCGFLGTTVAEIASHKAGIIKKGRPVFFGGSDETALAVIKEAALESDSELYYPPWDNISSASFDLSGLSFNYRGMRFELPLLGTYQLTNAANALGCIEILKNCGLDIPYRAVKEGLANVKWRGRFEVLRTEPYVIFDGSHNPDGIRFAADSIRRYFGSTRVALLIGVMADKEYHLYADMLDELTDVVFTVIPDNPRALDSNVLAQSFSEKGIPSCAFHELEWGVREAYKYAKEKNIPLIALGSLYMYREFTEALGKI